MNDYARLASFSFSSEEHFGKALRVFEDNGPLVEAPFDVVPVNTVLVPQEAVPTWSEWLEKRRIPFETASVLESRELPAETIAALRKNNYTPSF